MKKLVKVLLWVLGGLAGLVLVLVLALPVWFGPVVRLSANAIVPGVVKTDFSIGRLSLNPYTGRFVLGDLKLANPKVCLEENAVTLGDLAVDVGMTTLAGDVIHVESIAVSNVFVSVVNTDAGVGNFRQIQYNVAGGKEKYEAAEAEKKAEAKAEAARLEARSDAEKAADRAKAEARARAERESSGRKVVIDRLVISGVRMKLGTVAGVVVPLAIPMDIVLTDIGKASGGATLEEVWQAVVGAVMKSAGAVGDGAKALAGLAGDAFGVAGDAVGKAAGAATEAAGAAAGAVGDGAKAAAGAVGDGAKAVGGAVGDGAKAAAGAVGDGAKAVGDAAGKAVESLKGLFK